MILRDPVHGLVSFESKELHIIERLLQCGELQRLRRIRQLGLTSLAYPGADHTRFSHALGTAHVMSRFLSRMGALQDSLPASQRMTPEHQTEALAAALLHDIGHGPFSHLFEHFVPQGPAHEDWSERIICDPSTSVHRVLSEVDRELPLRVAQLVRGQHEISYLAHAVSGSFDVDRCDYLLRDAHFTGVSYGHFDLDWLLRSFCISTASTPTERTHLAIDGQKGLPAIESFLLARLFMFQQVYFHKASRASEWLLGSILRRMRALLIEGVKLPGVPTGLLELAQTGTTELAHYLTLDDSTLWTALPAFTQCGDPLLADLSQRLLSRHLFKAMELFGEQATPQGREQCLQIARDVARKTGLDEHYYVGLDVPSIMTYDDSSDPLTVLFRDGTEKKPGDVSFLLGRLRGQVLSRPRLIFAAELRAPLQQALSASSPPDGTLAGGSFGPQIDLQHNK